MNALQKWQFCEQTAKEAQGFYDFRPFSCQALAAKQP